VLCNDQRGTETSGLIAVSGFGPSLATNARRCCQNIPLQTGLEISASLFVRRRYVTFCGGSTASPNPVFQGWFARWPSATNQSPDAARPARPGVSWLVWFFPSLPLSAAPVGSAVAR